MSWASAIGGIVGGVVQGVGNRRALKHQNRNFNTAMRFEEHMANTVWQRGVADMRAAGLNPMLALSQGPNPAGSVSQPNVVNEGEGVAQSAAAIAQAVASNKLLNAQVANVEAQTEKTKAEADITKASVPFSAYNAEITSKKLEREFQQLGYAMEKLKWDRDVSMETYYGMSQDRVNKEKLQPLLYRYQELVNQSESLGIPLKEAEAKFWESVPEWSWLRKVIDLISDGADVAETIGGLGRKKGYRR